MNNLIPTYPEDQRPEKLYGDRVNGSVAISGIVHVIRSESELGYVREGAILVASFIDPEWSEQLSLAKALIEDAIAETSSVEDITSYYDLPAIINVKDAMACLRSGDIVTIHASGEIHRISEQRAPDSPMRVSVPAAVASRSAGGIITAPNVVGFSSAKMNAGENTAGENIDSDPRDGFQAGSGADPEDHDLSSKRVAHCSNRGTKQSVSGYELMSFKTRYTASNCRKLTMPATALQRLPTLISPLPDQQVPS